MLVRMAIFEGQVKPGREHAMRDYVTGNLKPLWEKFTGALEVKVLFGVQQDPTGPEIPCILQITYADQTAMNQALDSAARYESRDMLPGFYEQFFETVRLYHYVMEIA